MTSTVGPVLIGMLVFVSLQW